MSVTQWTAADTARWIAVPGPEDHKYTRGVLGVVTGSARYRGAAVLSVEAAVRTGLGMVRYLGDPGAAELVLARRPEVVLDDGRVQALVLGSGISAEDGDAVARMATVSLHDVPTVLDAGALGVLSAVGFAGGPPLTRTVLTPHSGELAEMLSRTGDAVERAEVDADPERWLMIAAQRFRTTVLLKGSTTRIVGGGAQEVRLAVTGSTPWLATAGSGDVLGGILGALLATHADRIAGDLAALASLAASAAVLHGLAAAEASQGGPIAALDIAEALPLVIARLLAEYRPLPN